MRSEIVDDVALIRLAKRLGLRAAFVDGDQIATCRMYRSGADVWRGFSKNLYEGIGSSSVALLAVCSFYFFAFVFPYVAAAVAVLWSVPGLLLPALVGVGVNLVLRLALAVRFRHGVSSIVFHPLAVLVLLGIGWNSYLWHRRGRVLWGGRTYAARSRREVS